MKENTEISEIILKVIDFLKVNKNSFAKKLGYERSQAVYDILSNKAKPSFYFFDKFINAEYSEIINIEWLISGKGSMLKTESRLTTLKEENEETRPRIPMDAAAGSLTMAVNGITANDCEQLPVIKAFARYDFTIFARGDSMLPEYHSGDELACLYIKNTTFVQWGNCHVLDTVQGIIVKRIYDDGEYIICRSENSELFKDFRIHKSEVYNIALVIGLVRRY